MPTPREAFAAIASRYGGVDPADREAVQRFFVETLPGLPRETIEEILAELLALDDGGSDASFAPCEPTDAELPRLDRSPPA